MVYYHDINESVDAHNYCFCNVWLVSNILFVEIGPILARVPVVGYSNDDELVHHNTINFLILITLDSMI